MADGKIKIMVVDTLEVWRKVIKNHVQKTGDIEVVGEFASGVDAMVAIEELNPDVIMLDADMQEPGLITGIIASIRSSKPEMRFLLCVDAAKKNEVTSAMDFGVYDFITKPYQQNILLRAIRESMSNPVRG